MAVLSHGCGRVLGHNKIIAGLVMLYGHSQKSVPQVKQRSGAPVQKLGVNGYEVFLLFDGDEFYLGKVEEVVHLYQIPEKSHAAFDVVICDLIADMMVKGKRKKKFTVELRDPSWRG